MNENRVKVSAAVNGWRCREEGKRCPYYGEVMRSKAERWVTGGRGVEGRERRRVGGEGTESGVSVVKVDGLFSFSSARGFSSLFPFPESTRISLPQTLPPYQRLSADGSLPYSTSIILLLCIIYEENKNTRTATNHNIGNRYRILFCTAEQQSKKIGFQEKFRFFIILLQLEVAVLKGIHSTTL